MVTLSMKATPNARSRVSGVNAVVRNVVMQVPLNWVNVIWKQEARKYMGSQRTAGRSLQAKIRCLGWPGVGMNVNK